ncbi:hypothetical protein GRI69_15595 [Erythrobacter vulgaris]|uniref:NERD domain-containing protein n=1 Tax=Qipengyuania vulgaris TaxID=291985 RepID=A0A844XX37_9SPHN|nr:nuclease-related domain-containing protein [Qipengyuania vulgaris]MXO49673.1 hypothetical protein [Qipengyuania vulgaris]
MIWKDADDRSGDIAQLERLLESAPEKHQSRISKQIANIRSGQSGERRAAHFLGREFGTSQSIGIAHDLRLELGDEVAQIDHLVIHRYQATAWVLETKNYAGRITCDEHGDWTVWNRGKPRDIPSPLNQARRQCELLSRWLEANDIAAIDKIQPVVLISPTSSVDRSKLPGEAHVVKSDNFGEWWRRQSEKLGTGTALLMMGKHFLKGMSEEAFEALGQRLAAAHRPSQYDWQAMLGLPSSRGSTEYPAAENGQLQPQVADVRELTGDGPWTFQTAAGELKVSRIPDGRFAIRNDRSDVMIEAVKTSCKGRGQWMPRYRNWLLAESEITEVIRDIISMVARSCLERRES